jgi:Xaa-Pro aminopeptidase
MSSTRTATASLDDYRAIQGVAKRVLERLGSTLNAEDTERSVADRAASYLREAGFPETWYYDCPAFVLLGSRSCASMSGRTYRPAEESVGTHNLVTVDLSPRRDEVWGDCARSFCIEGGRWAAAPADADFADGLAVEHALHRWLVATATPDCTAGRLFEAANAEIARAGFENLDFAGNVGHSIERSRDERRYIERGSSVRLREMSPFTFEPHIRRRADGRWGFKHENIYAFDSTGLLVEL